MSVAVTGVSHKTCPVELRERLAFPADKLPEALGRLHRLFPEGGCVILSTCNRVEIYLRSGQTAEAMHEAIRQFLADYHQVPQEEFTPHLYEFANREAVAHLFKVSCSLDSMVVGEGEILGQVHDAYFTAHAESATDKVLSALFQRAFKVAKEVRTKSNIGAGKVSVASVAVDLAVSIFTELAGKTAMIIGSGETGETALRHLVARGIGKIIIVNRTLEKAQELAAEFHGEALPLSQLQEHLHRADILISSTSAPTAILKAADFQNALKRRDRAPVFAIDIAVPRDIEPDVNSVDNVYLYDIDALQQVADQNLEARRAEIARCLKIVDAQVDRFVEWRQSLYAEPTIVSMAQELHLIRERELKKTLDSLPDLTQKQRDEVEYLTKRIVNNILQRPMSQIKQEVIREDPHRVLHLVKRLFGLEESAG
ncbi:MAG: glutamyl-tRNA reductase [Candidatus Hydrogenedentes bacterium]|nr:glutamyl-tRNA reductase [Candidatus Hydrogenedentota bacterium]MBI3117464.1 glutamyl-tRNA reductase [Candidatus Hydrogenedentota bacterium]